MSKADRILRQISLIFSTVGAIALIVLTLASAFDAAWRLIGGRPIPGVVDYGELLLVAVTFLGLALAQRYDDHIVVDVLVMRLPSRIARGAEIAGMLLVTLVLVWATYATTLTAVDAYVGGEQRFGLVRVPLWPARAVIPISLLVVTCEVLRRILALWQPNRLPLEDQHTIASMDI